MSQVSNSQDEVIDLLHLDRCPQCGYLLCGLPEQGRCPECGFAYRPEMIVLYGWARGACANDVNRRHGRNAWMVIEIAIGLLLVFALAGRLTLYSLLVPGVLLLVGARLIYRRRQLMAGTPAPVQLRLFPDGFAQRDGVGRVSLRPWSEGRHLRATRLRGGRYRVCSGRWYQTFLGSPGHVDFEFKADPQTAERLWERIDGWRKNAPQSDASGPRWSWLIPYGMVLWVCGITYLAHRYVPERGRPWVVVSAILLVVAFLFRQLIWLYLRNIVRGRLPSFIRRNVDGSWTMKCPRCSQRVSVRPGRKGEPMFECTHCSEKAMWTADWLPGED
jgi:hypothetical protein